MADNNSGEQQMMYLHGDLVLKIIEARDLPNMDFVAGRIRRCFACETCRAPSVKEDHDTDNHHEKQHRNVISSDPYVTVSVPQSTVARTRVVPNSRNPKWNEHFNIPLAHPLLELEFQVKDNDLFGADVMGTVKIPADKIASGEQIFGWFPVLSSNGQPYKPDTALQIEMKFTRFDQNPMYKHGIAGDPSHLGVRNTYFPLRKGCKVTLYQDAHVGCDVKMPEIKIDGGVYEQHHCWEDICYAIAEAHHMVYIAGWSVFHKVKLVREPTRPLPRGGDLTLGEMLKYKSEEGVRVLLLVWDDRTSHVLNPTGLMGTHDEETKKFFKHSSVTCVLQPRYGSSKLSIIKQQVVGGAFTHHQKCVIVDAQAFGNNRRITSFVGGLDLCDGRYDTPEHRLFRALDTVFKEDYHQPTFPVGTKAPRQPWHDLHSKIEGQAAYDVLVNFEQRWKKAAKWAQLSVLKRRINHWHDDALIKIERISWILSPTYTLPKDGKYTVIPEDDPKIHVSKEDHTENWHVQIFRSIDSGSMKGFPKNVHIAKAKNLICAKSLIIDKSIQTAYIQAIRSAKHFIYIENQYFIGSSYGWPSYKDAGADNLIPMELALKIASKIRSKERFAIYVILPMWPEGVPTQATMQEILFWQYQTIQLMYTVIARELKSTQLPDSHPLDYLNFYCLGNREKMSSEVSQSPGDAAEKISDAQKFERFMIYVHSKGMVVDDEYIIIGSANLNQRSLAGTKDTEIAMGSYQPHHTWAEKKRHPHGQIYGFRKSLWSEHLGLLEDEFEQPETLECVKKVNEIAVDNWRRYTNEEFSPLRGHLLKYPIDVDVNGVVGPLPNHEQFPDVGGKVLGAHSPTIPDILTT